MWIQLQKVTLKEQDDRRNLRDVYTRVEEKRPLERIHGAAMRKSFVRGMCERVRNCDNRVGVRAMNE
jgi:hypothetical protein